MSQAELARRANVARAYVSMLEHGHAAGSREVRSRLAAALGVSEAWLFTNEECDGDK